MSPPALILSWEDMEHDALALARELVSRGPWQGIVAIARGGLVPAALLARTLELQRVETLCLASYDGKRRGAVRQIEEFRGAARETKGAGWILVDDLVDSGATMEAARCLLPEAESAVLYAKPAGLARVHRFVRAVDQDQWLVFPWERGHG